MHGLMGLCKHLIPLVLNMRLYENKDEIYHYDLTHLIMGDVIFKFYIAQTVMIM